MKTELKPGLPLFELFIFLAIVLVGWAAFQIYKIELDVDRLQQDSQTSQQVFNELRGAFELELNQLHADKGKVGLELVDARTLKEEYRSVAEYLQTALYDLRTTLTGFMHATQKEAATEAKKHFERKQQELSDWIRKEKERAEAEHFQDKSLDLQQSVNKEQLASTNGPVSIRMGLRTLLNEIDRTYHANYETNATYVLNNKGAPLTGDLVSQNFARAEQAAQQLSELAQQARGDAEALQSFLDVQLQSEANKRAERQEKAIKALLDARDRMSFANRARPAPGTPPLPLRHVRYWLLVAVGGLLFFLMVAVYRGIVVTPLRLKLVQRDTIIEEQTKLASFQKLAVILAGEVRNPLTTISARLWTLQKNLEPGSEGHKDATDIGNEINRLDQVVKNFLELAGPAEPRLVVLNVCEALQEVHDLMAEHFKQQSIEFRLDCEQKVQFLADPPQLRQVLINLLKNALESLDHSGTVILRARRSTRSLNGDLCQAAVIEVQDTGPGIAPENRGRIFDPFFTTKQGRPGLGLAIAARIVANHDGLLEFESQPGKGAVFRLVLRAS